MSGHQVRSSCPTPVKSLRNPSDVASGDPVLIFFFYCAEQMSLVGAK